MTKVKTHHFEAKIALYEGHATWHFVLLPPEVAKEITELQNKIGASTTKIGVQATLKETSWIATLFADKKSKSYMLPLNTYSKKKSEFNTGDTVQLSIAVMGN